MHTVNDCIYETLNFRLLSYTWLNHSNVFVPDIDECEEMASMCAFRCQNLPGTFKCTCPYGYSLATDGRHCEGKYRQLLI